MLNPQVSQYLVSSPSAAIASGVQLLKMHLKSIASEETPITLLSVQ